MIEYREALEERGIKSLEEIENKVAIRRQQLQSEYGLLDSNDDSSRNSKCSFCKRARFNMPEFVNICYFYWFVCSVLFIALFITFHAF